MQRHSKILKFNMNITLFGATGETGLLALKNALAKGYYVTVYARNPSKIPYQNPRLKVMGGDLQDKEQVELAVKGANAVVSLLGPTDKVGATLLQGGIENIIAAMKTQKVKRLVATATPVHVDPKDKFQLSFVIGNFVGKIFMENIYKDPVRIGETIPKSNLDWTLVRIPVLNNKPAKGKLKIGYSGDGKVKFSSLTREDLAEFLVDQIEEKDYLQTSPVVCN